LAAAVAAVPLQQALKRLRHTPSGNLDTTPAKVCSFAINQPANHQLVLWNDPLSVEPTHSTLEAKRCHMMLTAAIGTAANLNRSIRGERD